MARLRLVCVPYAGAGAAPFRIWTKSLPAWLEPYALQLPGREDRLSEPPVHDWQEMMTAASRSLADLSSLPIAFYGHSLGAIIALSLARAVAEKKSSRLAHLFCAARPWPGDPTNERKDLHNLPDEQLLEILGTQYGALSALLSDPETRGPAMPALRADLNLLASYKWAQDPVPLPCPLTVFAGETDPITANVNLELWQNETDQAFRIRPFKSGHFFLHDQRDELLQEIVESLTSARFA
jgi:medium-chain acyl-[acyl-carrier-protein] hydrolase